MGKKIAVILSFLCLATFCFGQENFVYTSKGKRDPFMSLVTPEGKMIIFEYELFVSDMILEGIIFEPQGNSLAIINGKVVKVGEYIGSYAVLEIKQNEVILDKDGEKYILGLKREE